MTYEMEKLSLDLDSTKKQNEKMKERLTFESSLHVKVPGDDDSVNEKIQKAVIDEREKGKERTKDIMTKVVAQEHIEKGKLQVQVDELKQEVETLKATKGDQLMPPMSKMSKI